MYYARIKQYLMLFQEAATNEIQAGRWSEFIVVQLYFECFNARIDFIFQFTSMFIAQCGCILDVAVNESFCIEENEIKLFFLTFTVAQIDSFFFQQIITVHKINIFSVSSRDACITCDRTSLVGLRIHLYPTVCRSQFFYNLQTVIRGAVIDDDDFQFPQCLIHNAFYCLPNIFFGVIVSVVIPVYNTEKYVRQAVESVMYQSLKELEIIVVDDGSTDKSLSIVEKLGDTDKRIQIYTQANQGQSIARNRGISHAHGEYIYFMDSDDLLEEDALELCYHKCKEEKLDFVFFDALVFFENNVENAPTLNYKHTEKLEDKIYTGQEALEIQLQNKEYTPSVCLHFIHRNVIEKHNLSFYPEIVHEDQLFTTLLYLQSTKAACIKRTFFHRRMRKDSTMTSKFAMRNIKGYLVVTEEILSFRRQTTEDKNKEIIDLYLSQMLDAAMWQAHSLKLPERIKLARLCLQKYKKYVSTKTIGALLFKFLFINHKKTVDNG